MLHFDRQQSAHGTRHMTSICTPRPSTHTVLGTPRPSTSICTPAWTWSIDVHLTHAPTCVTPRDNAPREPCQHAARRGWHHAMSRVNTQCTLPTGRAMHQVAEARMASAIDGPVRWAAAMRRMGCRQVPLLAVSAWAAVGSAQGHVTHTRCGGASADELWKGTSASERWKLPAERRRAV